jgi:hypothetical protein
MGAESSGTCCHEVACARVWSLDASQALVFQPVQEVKLALEGRAEGPDAGYGRTPQCKYAAGMDFDDLDLGNL